MMWRALFGPGTEWVVNVGAADVYVHAKEDGLSHREIFGIEEFESRETARAFNAVDSGCTRALFRAVAWNHIRRERATGTICDVGAPSKDPRKDEQRQLRHGPGSVAGMTIGKWACDLVETTDDGNGIRVILRDTGNEVGGWVQVFRFRALERTMGSMRDKIYERAGRLQTPGIVALAFALAQVTNEVGDLRHMAGAVGAEAPGSAWARVFGGGRCAGKTETMAEMRERMSARDIYRQNYESVFADAALPSSISIHIQNPVIDADAMRKCMDRFRSELGALAWNDGAPRKKGRLRPEQDIFKSHPVCLRWVDGHMETSRAVCVGPPPPLAPDYRERCAYGDNCKALWTSPKLPAPDGWDPEDTNRHSLDFAATNAVHRLCACRRERSRMLYSGSSLPTCGVTGRQVSIAIRDGALYYHCEHCHGKAEGQR